MEIVKEGMQESIDVLAAYNAINDAFGLPENYENQEKMDKLMKDQGELQDKIDALGAWDIDTKLNIAMDALRCPDPDTKFQFSLVEKEEEWLFVVYYCKSQKFYCWTNQQII